MSDKGNCYDNACAETFFHSLKVEAIHGEQLLNREQTKSRVFEYRTYAYFYEKPFKNNKLLKLPNFDIFK